MERVIITGPTGTIGIALIQYLICNGVSVVAVCRKNSQRTTNIPHHELVQIVELDLNEICNLPQYVEGNFDVFYHFGWEGTFGDSRNNAYGQLQNIRYTLEAVEVASELGCKKFVGAGSQAEYGRVEGKLTGKTPTFPENGYGIAKLCAGQMSRILCEQKGIEHVWTRILSVYGPYDGENTMVMSTIRKLLNREHVPLTKAEQQWDYLYSKDAAKAMYLLGVFGKHGKIYCIGSGKVQQLREYAEEIKKQIDSAALLGYGDISYTEKQVMYLCADITDLTYDTGFVPEYAFEVGIKETIDWCKYQ